MIGVSIARRTRSGSGEGPGMCRKWRPTVREEFLAIDSPLLNGSFEGFSWFSHGRGPIPGGACGVEL